MNGQVSIEVAAGLTLAAKAVTTGNVAATVEPRAIRSWLMAAPLWSRRPNAVESGWSKALKEQRYFDWSKLLTSGFRGGVAAPWLHAPVMVLRCGVRECASGVFLRASAAR